MAITLGMVEAIDSDGVYVVMPGSRGLLRGPYKALSTVAAGTTVLVASTDDGEQVVVGPSAGQDGAVSVTAFGAKGDGVTDDTAAINAAILAAAATDASVVVVPPGEYAISAPIVLEDVSDLTLRGCGGVIQMVGTGARYSAVQLEGTVSSVTIEGLHIKGSGVLADAHAGIANDSGVTITDLRILGNTIEDTTIAVSVNADLSGSVSGALIEGNTILLVIGTAAGYGYGIHHASGDYAEIANVRILGNTIVDAGRHSIYQAKGRGVVVSGNTIRDHRLTGKAGQEGSLRPAIMLSRSYDVCCTGNVVVNSAGCAVGVDGTDGATESRNSTVTGNVFSGATDQCPIMLVGQQSPATEGFPSHVVIADNVFERNDDDGSLIYLLDGKHIRIANNVLSLRNAAALSTMLAIVGQSESTGTANYTDDIAVEGNTFIGQGSAEVNPVRLSGSEETAARLAFRDNIHVNNAGASDFFALSVSLTNPNVTVSRNPRTGLSATGGTLVVEELGDVTTDRVGFHGVSPIAKPTVTGSRGGNAALASLLTELANLGLITDSSS